MIAGPRMTMKRDGMMQNITGKTSFTGSFIACSSTIWDRLVRISEACTRPCWEATASFACPERRATDLYNWRGQTALRHASERTGKAGEGNSVGAMVKAAVLGVR